MFPPYRSVMIWETGSPFMMPIFPYPAVVHPLGNERRHVGPSMQVAQVSPSLHDEATGGTRDESSAG